MRIKTWLKDTLEMATGHFRGVLDDEDIGEILSELKSEHQASLGSKFGDSNSNDMNQQAFKSKIQEHLDNFASNLDNINREWNQTKEHQ